MKTFDGINVTPLWTDQVKRPEALPTREIPKKVDVAIVGSGYTGLNATLTLTEAGANVVVLEQNTIGWGASSRNGSMLTSGLKAKSKNIVRWNGEKMAKFFWHWSEEAISHVQDVVNHNQIDCDFVNVGNVYLASKPSHADSVKAFGEYLDTNFGYSSTRWVAKKDLPDEIGSEKYYGGLVDSIGCRLQPAKHVFGLVQVVAKKGARLVEHAKVTAISRNRGNFKITTEKVLFPLKKSCWQRVATQLIWCPKFVAAFSRWAVILS